MNRRTWKAGESRIAKIFGTVRTPLSGANSRHTSSDFIHDRIYGEVKHRTKMPFSKLWNEIVSEANKENKTPVLVLIEKGKHNPFIMCKLSDVKFIAKEIIDEVDS